MPLSQRIESSSVVELLTGSRLVQAAIQERAAAQTLHRRGLIGGLRRLEDGMEDRFPALQSAEADALAKVRKAEAALKAAIAAHGAALGERQSASFAYTREHDRLEKELEDSASSLIGDFLKLLDDDWQKTRHSAIALQESVQRNEITGSSATVIRSNTPSIRHRMEAIREAQEAARALVFTEPDQSRDNIAPKLQRLRESLPDVDLRLVERADR